MSAHSEHAARAGVTTPCTAHHVNFGGGCLNCGWLPAPYQPPMNWEERARRAEICAEDLAGALAELLPLVADRFKRDVARLPLERWTAHRADLDTLEGGGH
jgi:hypothetical protein